MAQETKANIQALNNAYLNDSSSDFLNKLK